MAIKAVIFDCFGVLALAGDQGLLDLYPDKKADIKNLAKLSDRGYISRAEYNKQLADLTGMSLREAESSFWLGDTRNGPLFSFIKENKEVYKMGLLSNIGKGWMDDFIPDRNDIFDAVVLSGEVGVAKPDPAIYEIMIDRLAVKPAECVFIDDRQECCEGAEDVGMQSIWFQDTGQALADLDEVLGRA